ncbi:uncharacterized protein LOC131650044 [Vicia villosa]|uniref:uncharacterized protein LOC131650044 n=1 Tax=Vicia villosa TaxID=3911 RepID=UPI00273C68AE|nr:uncharacterized protein LOC131650044 [Vicia villosa]
MNIALLSKWKWRILSEEEVVWRSILVSRYGEVKKKVLIGDKSVVHKSDSIWWRDIIIVDNYSSLFYHNFAGAVECNVGNGTDTPFWYCNWAATLPLRHAFPELFASAAQEFIFVAVAASGQYQGWNGDVVLRDSSVVSSIHWQELYAVTSHISLRERSKDSFVWLKSSDGVFSVRSCYDWFFSKLSGPPINSNVAKACSFLWKVKAPSKFIIFGWRVIHNRIATKDLLHKRGILDVNNLQCVFCSSEEDSLPHILGGCRVLAAIWNKVLDWIGYGPGLSLEEFQVFPFSFDKVRLSSRRSIVAIIWLATVWCVWVRRNDIIFNNGSFSFSECMSEIIFTSWKWSSTSYKLVNLCNFFLWSTQPLICFE